MCGTSGEQRATGLRVKTLGDRDPRAECVHPEARQQGCEHREEARHGHHEDVAVGDVRELVGKNALTLLRIKALPEAGRDADGGVLR